MPQADLEHYEFHARIAQRGEVLSVGDGIAWISGLPTASLNQLVAFEDGAHSRGVLFTLEDRDVGAIVLDPENRIRSGTNVRLDEATLSIGVGDELLGRVVDPLCRPLDGLPVPQLGSSRAIDVRAPSISERDFVHEPLYSGNTIVDTMLPIGRGQRQLLIGDRGIGKTSLALDAIVNQRESGVVCVYVLIGRKRTDVLGVIETLRETGSLQYTVVVVAEANAPPGLQYIAPYAGCTMAEHWMRAGRHTLIVYDDVTRHAQAYRTLTLLLRRPPGREAYPGDIFFLHSRLLERSTVLASELGGGSMTALPIVETEEGEIADYIPTNLISITDGQLYFSSALFSSGSLPAIDVTTSVSRVGGRAQAASVRAEAGKMRLEYLQFLELERFSRLGTRLEASTAAKIERGRILRAILRQARLTAHTILYELAWMIAFNEGLLDRSTPDDVAGLLERLETTLRTTTLGLDSPRSEWIAALRSRLA
jgi:F-type H+-transporting ATPase subunit alpha